MNDPFPLVKQEVEKALAGVNQVYEQWKVAVNNDPDEAAWAANEVKTGAKDIEWDLQELEKCIDKVRSDSRRFTSISQGELDTRNQFVTSTRQHLQDLTREVSSQNQGNSTRHNRSKLGIEKKPQNKYAALEREIQADHSRFIGGHQQMQQEMYDEQEKGLAEVSIAVDTLHHMGNDMNDELSRQAKDLESYDTEMTQTTHRVGRAIRKVDDLISKADNKAGYWIIAALLILLLILFVVFFLV